MIDVELNNRINALWLQLPQDLRLDEKFYGYIATNRVSSLANLVDQYPVMKEIALADQSILFGPAYEYHRDMMEYLVKGLGLNVEFRRQETLNLTLLMEAVKRHHSQHRNVNLSVNEKFARKCQTIAKLIELGANVNAADYMGTTTLQYAISCLELSDLIELDNSLAAIEMLLQAGANVNQQNYHGYTVLHYALQKDIPLDVLEPVLRLLIHYGADENIADKTGRTPKIMILQRSPVTSIGQTINKFLS